MDLILVFPRLSEFEKARTRLEALRLPHRVVSAAPGYAAVGVPALVCGAPGQAAIQEVRQITCAGWTDYRPADGEVPNEPPPRFDEDVFGEAAIMFFGPCMADETRIRLIAHLSGDLTAALPHVNTAMPRGSYNAGPGTLTYMDEQRLITLYPRRVTVGKAADLVDGWRTLEKIRVMVNGTWARRAEIPPLFEMRAKPPVLEVYKRLPRTNCKACGEMTCMAFAARLWSGKGALSECAPVYSQDYAHLRAPLLEMCAALGVAESEG